MPNWPHASGPVLQWVRIRSGPSSRAGRTAAPNPASRPWSSVASKTMASASARTAAAIASPSSDRSPTASYADITRSTAQRRLTAVGRELRRTLAAPRSVARRAYGRVDRLAFAVSASPTAAACPIAGAPRMIISRIA